MTVGRTIKAVHLLRTGFGEQHKEHRYGSRLPRIWWVLMSRSWVRIPISAFLVEHRDGLILFDTGIDPAIVSDSNYISSAIGRYLLGRIFRFHVAPEDRLGKVLEAHRFSASDVQKVVISHLHFDHIGGIADVPQAELLVSRDEWRQLSQAHPERNWVLREHIEIPGAQWRQIDFTPTNDPLLAPFGECYDVMGDESVVLLPTPGHTPGSLSMLLRAGALPPLLLTGDLTYELDLLMKDQVPGVGEPAQLRSSFAKVRALRHMLPDLTVLPSHDPAVGAALAAWAARLEDSC